MNNLPAHTLTVTADQAGQTLAALLRPLLPGQSWSQVRRLIETRHARIGGELCLDPARRLNAGEQVELLDRPAAPVRLREAINIRYIDNHLIVVEKPPGLPTVRHPAERDWDARRKALNPTLDDLLMPLIAQREDRLRKGTAPRLRIVHRIDKDTSGLVVFARTVTAERGLGLQFKGHTVSRRYLALVPGKVASQRIATRLVRDRGDGRRGSTPLTTLPGKDAVTHVEAVERLPGYTLLSCRLETGRTHQIRIHLAELGHPICGDKVYHRKADGTLIPDVSGAPRMALHAAELGFEHPATKEQLLWEMALPDDLQGFLEGLRNGGKTPKKN